jgi:hypothetical protein
MIGFIKDREKITEYLPKSEQLTTQTEERILFFNLYNYYVEKEMRVTKKEMLSGENIYEVFKNKIASLPNNSKLKQRFSNLIAFNNGELLFNLDDMFLHLVYERVKLVNKNAQIYLYDKSIVIQENVEGVSPTLLIPAYEKVSGATLYEDEIIAHHLKTVLKTLKETQIRQIYLVYPKHDKFKKHIQLKLMDRIPLSEDEYRVKVIPYSFSFCTRTARKCCSVPNKLKGKI